MCATARSAPARPSQADLSMHTTRALGPGAGLGWLRQAINLGRSNPRAVFGAVALLALVALVPSLVQLVLQHGLKLGADAMVGVAGVITLLMLVVYPLLIGGLLRVIDAAEHARPTHATALFAAFRADSGAGRLVGFGVLISLIYVAAFGAVIAAFGPGLFGWYMQVLDASMQGDQAAAATAMQAVPDGLGTVMALGTLVGLFCTGVYAIGFGQVALTERPVLAALGDGIAGTLKNLLPIVLLAAVATIGLLVFVAIVALLLAVLMGLGSLVHPVVGMVLALPVYMAMLLVLYVVMFGVMYFMWRDVCGATDAATGETDTLAV